MGHSNIFDYLNNMFLLVLKSLHLITLGQHFVMGEKYDNNGDGQVTIEEILLVIRPNNTNLDLKALFENADYNEDGILDNEEVDYFDHTYGNALSFNNYDTNEDGILDNEEIDYFDILIDYDTNGDGEVTIDEIPLYDDEILYYDTWNNTEDGI